VSASARRPSGLASRAPLALVVLLLLTLSTVLTACVRSDSLLVLTASSAQDAVRSIAEANPAGVDVASGGSSSLVRQIAGGASADVLITADEATMRTARDQGLLDSDPVTVATSRLVIAVPAAQAPIDQVSSLSEFDFNNATLVLCSQPVPCGAAAQSAFVAVGIDPQVSSYEPNSRQALAKVGLGVADVALVWEVDLASDDRAAAVASGAQLPVTRYQAAVVRGSAHPDRAGEFIEQLTTGDGRAVLAEYGFLPFDYRDGLS
jgi:molybdate transport system substrate-binding protein